MSENARIPLKPKDPAQLAKANKRLALGVAALGLIGGGLMLRLGFWTYDLRERVLDRNDRRIAAENNWDHDRHPIRGVTKAQDQQQKT
ncbi:hypothetical protein PROFUN_06259 [Planoprotostelium fungivorum]|uniref:Uncharacterized protein n=1 Tax=Planoprotostelium fungivorum TaxID=1890364 RepID=A0A2P6NE58_9EUKA|nr:hypothetical protein PROFUN_06259 [Planoprotostelium fungivorum]